MARLVFGRVERDKTGASTRADLARALEDTEARFFQRGW
jgi:hypothetical protein